MIRLTSSKLNCNFIYLKQKCEFFNLFYFHLRILKSIINYILSSIGTVTHKLATQFIDNLNRRITSNEKKKKSIKEVKKSLKSCFCG